jgi:hypothetical protein
MVRRAKVLDKHEKKTKDGDHQIELRRFTEGTVKIAEFHHMLENTFFFAKEMYFWRNAFDFFFIKLNAAGS